MLAHKISPGFQSSFKIKKKRRIMPLLKENKHFKEIMETKKVNNEVKNSLIVSIKLTKSQSDLLKQRRKIE